MAIREGKAAGAIMIARGGVRERGTAYIWIRFHIRAEEAVINTVRMLIHEDPGVGSGDEVRLAAKHPPRRTTAEPGRRSVVPTNPRADRIAAQPLARWISCGKDVRRALV